MQINFQFNFIDILQLTLSINIFNVYFNFIFCSQKEARNRMMITVLFLGTQMPAIVGGAGVMMRTTPLDLNNPQVNIAINVYGVVRDSIEIVVLLPMSTILSCASMHLRCFVSVD